MNHILLCHSSEYCRVVISNTLLKFNFAIYETANRLEAIKTINNHPIELAIIDSCLPNSKSSDLLCYLNLKKNRPSAIILTDAGNVAEIQKCMALGTDIIFYSPVILETLAAKVENILETKKDSKVVSVSYPSCSNNLTVCKDTLQ